MREVIFAFQLMYYWYKRKLMHKKTDSEIFGEIIDAILLNKELK